MTVVEFMAVDQFGKITQMKIDAKMVAITSSGDIYNPDGESLNDDSVIDSIDVYGDGVTITIDCSGTGKINYTPYSLDVAMEIINDENGEPTASIRNYISLGICEYKLTNTLASGLKYMTRELKKK